MREYGIVSPMFWIGETGRALRKNPNAQRVAIYLMTAPSSEMTGVFYCPLSSILNDVGVFEAPLNPLVSPSGEALEVVNSPLDGVKQAIQTLIELDFCFYDFESGFVFVTEMARWQIAEELKPTDNRVVNVRKLVKAMPNHIAARFLMRYNDVYHLGFDPEIWITPFINNEIEQASLKPLARGLIEPLGSQEQEQKQEQDISTNVDKKEKVKKEKKSKTVLSKPDDVSSDQIWSDFNALRNAKHAPLTETALNIIRKEAEKAGITLEQALETCCMRGWQGFKAEWYRKGQNNSRFQSYGPRDIEPEFRPEDYEGGLISDLLQR